jgi:hypothetical protein
MAQVGEHVGPALAAHGLGRSQMTRQRWCCSMLDSARRRSALEQGFQHGGDLAQREPLFNHGAQESQLMFTDPGVLCRDQAARIVGNRHVFLLSDMEVFAADAMPVSVSPQRQMRSFCDLLRSRLRIGDERHLFRNRRQLARLHFARVEVRIFLSPTRMQEPNAESGPDRNRIAVGVRVAVSE